MNKHTGASSDGLQFHEPDRISNTFDALVKSMTIPIRLILGVTYRWGRAWALIGIVIGTLLMPPSTHRTHPRGKSRYLVGGLDDCTGIGSSEVNGITGSTRA